MIIPYALRICLEFHHLLLHTVLDIHIQYSTRVRHYELATKGRMHTKSALDELVTNTSLLLSSDTYAGTRSCRCSLLKLLSGVASEPPDR